MAFQDVHKKARKELPESEDTSAVEASLVTSQDIARTMAGQMCTQLCLESAEVISSLTDGCRGVAVEDTTTWQELAAGCNSWESFEALATKHLTELDLAALQKSLFTVLMADEEVRSLMDNHGVPACDEWKHVPEVIVKARITIATCKLCYVFMNSPKELDHRKAAKEEVAKLKKHSILCTALPEGLQARITTAIRPFKKPK